MELGYHVTLVKNGTAAFNPEGTTPVDQAAVDAVREPPEQARHP
jgi:hypothetical protein